MAARESILPLVAALRNMIGDDPGVDQVFQDEDLERYLDKHRIDVYDWPLEGDGFSFSVPMGGWEADSVLYLNGVAVTPDEADWVGGRWVFLAEQSGIMRLTGKTYDLHASASEVLLAWAARYARRFDFATGGQSFSRSQAARELREQADVHRRQARVGSVPIA